VCANFIEGRHKSEHKLRLPRRFRSFENASI